MMLTALAMANFYYHYSKLRKLLRQYNRPLSNILYNMGILKDIKYAKSLINELGSTEEGQKVKEAIKKTDLSFIFVIIVFFGSGAIFLKLFK